MTEQVDVVVLGMGTSGEEIAGRLAAAGLEVAGIEPALVGGECAYWACLPTKAMVRAANLVQEARRVNELAGRADVTPDWSRVAGRIRDEVTADWDDSAAVRRFENRGGRFVRAKGRLTGPRTVSADGRTYEARRGIVICTGSVPSLPAIDGLADVPYWTSHGAVSAPELPESLLVVGGGSVACELGQVYARFGCRVTIVERGERLLGPEEPEVGQLIADVFAGEGITFYTKSSVERVRPAGNAVAATLADGTELRAERLLVATGRRPNIDDLGLEAVGIDASGGAIRVDQQLRAADGIWAVGDVTDGALFTHVALHEAEIVEAALLGRPSPKADKTALPRVTFTDPEIGAVGLTEALARENGFEPEITLKQLPATFRGWLHGPGNQGLLKLVVDPQADVLVGATAAGPAGGEVIGMLGLAVNARLPREELRRMIYAFPTFHGGVGEALGAYGRALVAVVDPALELRLRQPA